MHTWKRWKTQPKKRILMIGRISCWELDVMSRAPILCRLMFIMWCYFISFHFLCIYIASLGILSLNIKVFFNVISTCFSFCCAVRIHHTEVRCHFWLGGTVKCHHLTVPLSKFISWFHLELFRLSLKMSLMGSSGHEPFRRERAPQSQTLRLPLLPDLWWSWCWGFEMMDCNWSQGKNGIEILLKLVLIRYSEYRIVNLRYRGLTQKCVI